MSKRADPRRRETGPGKPLPVAVTAISRATARDDASASDRLARLLDAPHLAQVVPHLAPEVIHHLIRHRGLDACGALVAAATPQQVASVLDLDLWRPAQAGRDDRFDEQRFGSWLETLMAEGEAVAARVVAAMDRHLAIVGLSRLVRVFDVAVLRSVPSTDDDFEGLDVVPAGDFECEVGGYIVQARTPHAWDAIVGLLVTLSTEDPDCFRDLMQGCGRLSNSTPEIDGLDELMLEPEQLLHDVSVEREGRRMQQGYVTASDARAFLQMSREPRQRKDSSSINPIVAASFRALDDPPESPGQPAQSEKGSAGVDPLEEADLAFARPRALLGPVPDDATRVTPIQPLMEYVHDADPVAYSARSRELGFLANALLAGCSVYSRSFTVEEAWNAAVGICSLGLEVWPEGRVTITLPAPFLVDHDLVSAFEAGWRLLHQDVTMFVAERLIATLADLRSIDPVIERDLHRLRRELVRHRDAGTPWRVRQSLDVIAILDTPTWACLLGLLSECPVFPAALTAILERQTGSINPIAFECFARREQIRKVHEFAERLVETLLH